MKLRNIILSLVALVAVTVSCEQEIDHYLDNFVVSSSSVALATDGATNTCTIGVNANQAWTVQALDPKKEGAWLTVSPMSGSAGESTITFSAPKTLDGRNCEVRIVCGGETQIINVIQGLAVIAPATCAEVINGIDGKSYQVTGICTNIANTSYGNWYLDDGTGEIYVYGTVDASGSYNWNSFGIEVGDEVTVSGPRKNYNGTIELVDATFIKVNKSLIKVKNTIVNGKDTTNVVPTAGGTLQVNLENKGEGIYTSVPDAAKSWITLTAVANNEIYFNVAENTEGDRSATLIFSTTKDKKSYNCEVTIQQKGAIIDITVADFNAAPKSTIPYRVQGVVTSIKGADYGNFYIKDATGETYVYGLGDKGYFPTTGIKVGDVVVLVGNRDEYKGTIELVKATLEKHIKVTEVSIEDFLKKADDKNVWYMVTGTVSKIANTTYGNLYMNDGKGNEVYVYGCYTGWNATGDFKKKFKDMDIAVNDELTMIGYKDTYQGTIELCGGVYFSHKKAN